MYHTFIYGKTWQDWSQICRRWFPHKSRRLIRKQRESRRYMGSLYFERLKRGKYSFPFFERLNGNKGYALKYADTSS